MLDDDPIADARGGILAERTRGAHWSGAHALRPIPDPRGTKSISESVDQSYFRDPKFLVFHLISSGVARDQSYF